jgi:hypothetical protein
MGMMAGAKPMKLLLIATSVALVFAGAAEARGHSHGYVGGHYAGGHGSSHRGGHYVNPRTGNHYTHHYR